MYIHNYIRMNKYQHIKKIIESGVDEFFEQVFENYYYGLTEEELNYLLILSCDKNELDMAKIIYSKSKELNTIEYNFLIFRTEHNVITNTTLEICLLRALVNGNFDMYEWLKNLGTKIPDDKSILYWKAVCNSGNYRLIYEIFTLDIEKYEKYLSTGLKIFLEKGYYEIFKEFEKINYNEEREWIFSHYLKSKKADIDFFYHLYPNYYKYFSPDTLFEFIKKDRVDEIKIVLQHNNMIQSSYIKMLIRYLESDNILSSDTFILLLNGIKSIEFRKNIVIKYFVNKITNIDDIKKIITWMEFDKEIIKDFYEIVYSSYKNFKFNSNSEELEFTIQILEWLITVGHEPTRTDDFYHYYIEKKNEILYQRI